MRAEYLARQSDLISEESLAKKITIIGAGAIGSFTALSLAKMGYNDITVYDFDSIDDENMNCQFYPITAIGGQKVAVLKKMVKAFTGVVIKAYDRAVEETDIITGDYLIVAVDSMEVRKMVYENCFQTNYLIDPRMGAEYATIETLKACDTEEREASYQKTLYSDEEAVQERCTAKSTIYTVMLIAGQISKIVKDTASGNNFIKNLDWDIANNALQSWNYEQPEREEITININSDMLSHNLQSRMSEEVSEELIRPNRLLPRFESIIENESLPTPRETPRELPIEERRILEDEVRFNIDTASEEETVIYIATLRGHTELHRRDSVAMYSVSNNTRMLIENEIRSELTAALITRYLESVTQSATQNETPTVDERISNGDIIIRATLGEHVAEEAIPSRMIPDMESTALLELKMRTRERLCERVRRMRDSETRGFGHPPTPAFQYGGLVESLSSAALDSFTANASYSELIRPTVSSGDSSS